MSSSLSERQQRNDGRENYNSRGNARENYNRRGDFGENYNRRNDGGENYNHMGDGGENNNRRSNIDENYNRRNDSDDKSAHDVPDAGRVERVHGLPGASGDEDDAGGVAKEARRRQREVSIDSKSASDKDSVAAAAATVASDPAKSTATAAAGEDDHGGHKGAVVPALRVGARPCFSSLKAGPPTTSSLQPTTFLNAAAFVRKGLASGNLASLWLSDGGNGTWKDRVVHRPLSLLACPLHTLPSGQFLFSHSVPESGSRSRHQLRSTETTDGSTGEECFTIRFSAALEDDNMEVPDSGRMELVHGEIERSVSTAIWTG
ncbi:hypothetical protein EJB05_06295, partial [Eragrostis curvula]